MRTQAAYRGPGAACLSVLGSRGSRIRSAASPCLVVAWLMPGLGEGVGNAAQQGADRRRGHTVQDRPVQAGAQASKRWPVAAVQRQAGLLQALGPELQVGIQHWEQA